MIKDKMRDALNQQIKEELESAYLYMSMAAWFHSQGLDGMAQWMKSQTVEEINHAMKFFGHITGRDGRVELLPLGIEKTEWSSPLEAFQDAYKHEQYITGKINELVGLAHQENDYAAHAMLQWFVTEQVEEEASTSKVAHELQLVGCKGDGLLMLDRELGQRMINIPPAPAETV
jgi:ferritin